jgi:ABC-type nickel/cobalt efflux system permease component RcnA
MSGIGWSQREDFLVGNSHTAAGSDRYVEGVQRRMNKMEMAQRRLKVESLVMIVHSGAGVVRTARRHTSDEERLNRRHHHHPEKKLFQDGKKVDYPAPNSHLHHRQY